jgi:hypothetical protein
LRQLTAEFVLHWSMNTLWWYHCLLINPEKNVLYAGFTCRPLHHEKTWHIGSQVCVVVIKKWVMRLKSHSSGVNRLRNAAEHENASKSSKNPVSLVQMNGIKSVIPFLWLQEFSIKTSIELATN